MAGTTTRNVLDSVSKAELEELYWGQCLSTRDIGSRLGINHSWAGELLRRFNIPRRSPSEAYQTAELAGKKMHLYGPDHPNFKGYSYLRKGYRVIFKPDHPRATIGHGYVFEHIVVWEESHHMPLPDGWIVHHINGIKDDNRPKNLKGLPRKKHNTREFIEALQARIRELEGVYEPYVYRSNN